MAVILWHPLRVRLIPFLYDPVRPPPRRGAHFLSAMRARIRARKPLHNTVGMELMTATESLLRAIVIHLADAYGACGRLEDLYVLVAAPAALGNFSAALVPLLRLSFALGHCG